jgi:16S rRNA (guanine527-N7)-methyltransferase
MTSLPFMLLGSTFLRSSAPLYHVNKHADEPRGYKLHPDYTDAELAQQSEPRALVLAGAAAIGITLGPAQIEQLALLSDTLLAGNARANLTAITDPSQVAVKHLVDSLTLVPFLREALGEAGGSLVDVGTGAGLPGLVLAIALPFCDVTLIEATARKVAFLEHAVEVLRLPNVRVVSGRAEDIGREPAHREYYDAAVVRAVGGVATLVELLAPLLRVGRVALLMKTHSRAGTEIERAAHALAELHSRVERIVDLSIPGLLEDRALVVVRKEEPTPERYPRRSGLPERRPLRQI